MSSVLADSYNLMMSRFMAMRQGGVSPQNNIPTNTPPSNDNQTNTKPLENKFNESLGNALDVNKKPSYTNGKKVTYNGEVKALSNPKIKNIIKKHGIDKIVDEAAKKYDLPPQLIYKVIETESYFNLNCKSSAGAMGLMQLMPVTANEEGVSNPYDPYQNIMGGASQLRKHLNSFNGDLKLALAAYNAGPGNVRKYGGVPPFKETQNYIRKILGVEP